MVGFVNLAFVFPRAVNASCYPPDVLTLYYWAASLTMQPWSDRTDIARNQQFPGFEGVCVCVCSSSSSSSGWVCPSGDECVH